MAKNKIKKYYCKEDIKSIKLYTIRLIQIGLYISRFCEYQSVVLSIDSLKFKITIEKK